MKKLNYLMTVAETAAALAKVYQKSGDSEKNIAAYQNWDEISERLRKAAKDKDQVEEFENIEKYMLFGEESKDSNNLLSAGLIEKPSDFQDIPDVVITQVLEGLIESFRISIKGMKTANVPEGVSKNDIEELIKVHTFLHDYFKERIKSQVVSIKFGLNYLKFKEGKISMYEMTKLTPKLPLDVIP